MEGTDEVQGPSGKSALLQGAETGKASGKEKLKHFIKPLKIEHKKKTEEEKKLNLAKKRKLARTNRFKKQQEQKDVKGKDPKPKGYHQTEIYTGSLFKHKIGAVLVKLPTMLLWCENVKIFTYPTMLGADIRWKANSRIFVPNEYFERAWEYAKEVADYIRKYKSLLN